MTDKQKLILDYLSEHNGAGYYLDIRNSLTLGFDNEEEFDRTLSQLVALKLVHENEISDTLYHLTFSNLKIKYAIPHVTLFQSDDEILLRIEDYELFDTFEDIIYEQFDLEYDYVNREEINGVVVCTMHFNSRVDQDKLNQAVKSIDQNEVERIFSINNSIQ